MSYLINDFKCLHDEMMKKNPRIMIKHKFEYNYLRITS